MKMKCPSEHTEQVLLFRWMSYRSELYAAFAVPNGGHRHIAVATKMKAEGVKAGVPDIFIPVARNNFHGLFIEMKSQKGRQSDLQKEFAYFLHENGYKVEVCHGFEQAKVEICKYMGWRE